MAGEKGINPLELLSALFKDVDLGPVAKEIVDGDPKLKESLAKKENSELFLKKLEESYKKYKGVLIGARLIDSWDALTSGLNLIMSYVLPGLEKQGITVNIDKNARKSLSKLEDIVEMIPKIPYILYYTLKTNDFMAAPYWLAAEAASAFLPAWIGEAIDIAPLYIMRANKRFKEEVKRAYSEALKPAAASA